MADKTVEFSKFTINEARPFMWVAMRGEAAIGIIVAIENDIAIIEWLDGGPTQHRVDELAEDEIYGVVASSTLPERFR